MAFKLYNQQSKTRCLRYPGLLLLPQLLQHCCCALHSPCFTCTSILSSSFEPCRLDAPLHPWATVEYDADKHMSILRACRLSLGSDQSAGCGAYLVFGPCIASGSKTGAGSAKCLLKDVGVPASERRYAACTACSSHPTLSSSEPKQLWCSANMRTLLMHRTPRHRASYVHACRCTCTPCVAY